MSTAPGCTRFPAPKGFVAEGSRGPSVKRISTSRGGGLPDGGVRGPVFGSLRRRTTIDDGTLSRAGSSSCGLRPESQGLGGGIIAKSDDALKNAHGALCFVCGAETLESGRGLRQCPECRSIQLAGGGMSHAFAEKHPDQALNVPEGTCARAASKGPKNEGNKADNPIDAGTGTQLNPLLARSAWRSIAKDAQIQMAHVHGCCGETVLAPDEEREPIMAGYVDTGYAKGDRVKTTLRLPGAIPSGAGWDPIDCQTDEGTVTGPGNKAGEIMVQFDAGGHVCSMKMGQIAHVKIVEARTNVDRSRRRKSTITRIQTIG